MPTIISGLAAPNEHEENIMQMALLSKRMELEAQARMQELEKQHQLSLVPGEQVGSVLQGIRGNTAALAGQNIPEGLAQTAATATGLALRSEAYLNKPYHVVTKPDQNNVVTAGFQDPQTGNWIGQPQQTLDPSAQKELQKVDLMTQNAKNMVNGVLERAKSILPNAPAGVPITKLSSFWQQKGLPTNPDLKAFVDSMGALSAQYIKDTTGMAPRSLELMKLDTASFPNVSDDIPTAVRKAQILSDTAENKAATAHTIYDPKNIVPSPFHPIQKGHELAKNQQVNMDDEMRQQMINTIQANRKMRGLAGETK